MTESGALTEADERPGSGGGMDAVRVLALSDAVFAIAATLLVLDLRIPEEVRPEELPAALRDLLPAVGGYALSYLLIGLLWLGHHRQFRCLHRISPGVARLNLLFLGTVSVLPFVTTLIARYGDQRPAVQLYAATGVAIFLLELAIGALARRAGDVADLATARRLQLRALAVALVFAASIGVAAIPQSWAPLAAKYCWLLIIPARMLARLAAERSAARPAPQ